jgi:3-oxoadipate enol-lactonase
VVRRVAGFAAAADGVRIAFRDEGPAERPPVLLCSMGTAAMSVWDAVAGPLSEDWRVILHDRRGDGDSDPGAPESHSFPTYARDALTVLDHLACAAATVCGMAFGARVALRLGLDAPARVNGLMLFDATGGPPAPEAERLARSAEAAKLRAAAGLPAFPRERSWFARRDPTGQGLSRHAFQRQPDWVAGLQGVRIRTQIACGDHDPNLPGARRLAAEIPGAAFTLMPMTGHASILDRPDLVLDILRGFLQSAPTAAA